MQTAIICFAVVGMVVVGIAILGFLYSAITIPKEYKEEVNYRLEQLEDFRKSIESKMLNT